MNYNELFNSVGKIGTKIVLSPKWKEDPVLMTMMGVITKLLGIVQTLDIIENDAPIFEVTDELKAFCVLVFASSLDASTASQAIEEITHARKCVKEALEKYKNSQGKPTLSEEK